MAVTTRMPGLDLTTHEFRVPLDHARPDGPRITLFAREAAAPDGHDRPYLLYLQGGPGQEAPRPTRRPANPGWLERALQDFVVLFLDQRGTGLSSPVEALPGTAPEQQLEYLRHFRADSIVADAEWVRAELGAAPWSVLGQSFGGFCALTYLSFSPEGLREALFTGGVPPIGHHPDEIYRSTFTTMAQLSEDFYRRFPGDRDRVRAIHDLLAHDGVRLPTGDRLTSRRFQQLGHLLGRSGGAEALHYLVERDPASTTFGYDVANTIPFHGRNPLYAVLQEACYADGLATRWSAERVQPEAFDDLTLFTGEHVFGWLYEDESELRPWREVAQLLAEHDWPALYDAQRLQRCEVPCAAMIYADDAYVVRDFSEETAALIPTMRKWLSNEYQHNGLRADGARILDRLIGLARDEI